MSRQLAVSKSCSSWHRVYCSNETIFRSFFFFFVLWPFLERGAYKWFRPRGWRHQSNLIVWVLDEEWTRYYTRV